MKKAPARLLSAGPVEDELVVTEPAPAPTTEPTVAAPTMRLSAATTMVGPLTASPLTDAQIAEARAELGSEVDLVDLQSRYNRLDDFAAAITEVLRERLATLKADPAIFAVDGYSQNVSANIAALEAQLAGRTGEAVGGISVVRIVPPPAQRRR